MKFYSKLYTAEALTPDIMANREAILASVQQRFTPSMAQTLVSPLTESELHHALLQMGKGHSPGLDGLTIDFFCKYWEFIGLDFTEMVLQSIAQGRLPIGMNSGNIAFIFKAGDRANLSN